MFVRVYVGLIELRYVMAMMIEMLIVITLVFNRNYLQHRLENGPVRNRMFSVGFM